MKKPFLIIVSALLVMTVLSGCFGNKKDNKNIVIDTQSLITEILTNVTFKDSLEKLDSTVVDTLYNYGENISTVVYAGSGATPEEIIVVEAPDEDTAKKIADGAITDHWKVKVTEFTEYNPEERPKLDDKILVQCGKYVIYCVSDDNKNAGSVVNDYIK